MRERSGWRSWIAGSVSIPGANPRAFSAGTRAASAPRSPVAGWRAGAAPGRGRGPGRSSPPADPTRANRSAPPKVGSRQRLFGEDGEPAMRHHLIMNPETLTVSELLAIFGRTPDDRRWVGFADSAEYLSV